MQLDLIDSQAGNSTEEKKKRVRRPKGKLYEPRHVKTAMEFIRTLVGERLSETSSTQELNHDFNHNKNIISKMMGSAQYRDLPEDAKSFISRCASLKRLNKGISFSRIAQQQEALVKHHSDELWRVIVAIADEGEALLQQARRRRRLVLRMIGYPVSFEA